MYRIADPADFDDDARAEANEYLVWLTAYRQGPISARGLADQTGLAASEVDGALATLAADGRVEQVEPADGGSDGDTQYRSPRFDVPVGESYGWEAAVLDHQMLRGSPFVQGGEESPSCLSTYARTISSGAPPQLTAQ